LRGQLGFLFLVPRPRRLKETGGPGAQLEFALQIISCSFARGTWKRCFIFQILPNTVSVLQEMFPNVFQTQTFAGGTFWREIRSTIQVAETASHFKMQDANL